jgi:hypothetical protein
MPESISDQILDDLIVHDVQVRRVIGGAQRTSAQLHIEMEKKLTALFIEMDPQTDAQVARYLARAKAIMRDSFNSQKTTLNATLRKVARAENDAVNGTIENLLNE